LAVNAAPTLLPEATFQRRDACSITRSYRRTRPEAHTIAVVQLETKNEEHLAIDEEHCRGFAGTFSHEKPAGFSNRLVQASAPNTAVTAMSADSCAD
jgi:Fe-S oxidoreductase